MSFDTVDSLKAYLDATMGQTKDGKIIVTCEDAEQIIDYLPTYFENKEVEYCDSYDEYYKYELKKTGAASTNVQALGTFDTLIPLMTTRLPKRLSDFNLQMEQLKE